MNVKHLYQDARCNDKDHTIHNLLVTITSKVINHSVKVSKVRMGININVPLQEKSHHLRSGGA